MFKMFSESSANLQVNEILAVLERDPNLNQQTKQGLSSLKVKTNRWQDDLTIRWNTITYPSNTQATIRKINALTKKDVDRINAMRHHQREWYRGQNLHQAASMIPDLEDQSMKGKDAIIESPTKVEGWNPTTRNFETICYNRVVDIKDFTEKIHLCSTSQAINIPKSILNLLEEGQVRGFTAENFTSLFLLFINTYLPEAYISALTFSTDVDQLFTYLISLVNTSHEVEKIRNALASIERKPNDPLTGPILKTKALTVSLLYMLQPASDEEDVSRRANIAAGDAIFSLINSKAGAQLRAYKRRAVEIGKRLTLQELLESTSNIENMEGCSLTETLLLPGRFSQAETQQAFLSQQRLTDRNKQPFKKDNTQRQRNRSGTSNSSGENKSSSRSYSRGSRTDSNEKGGSAQRRSFSRSNRDEARGIKQSEKKYEDRKSQDDHRKDKSRYKREGSKDKTRRSRRDGKEGYTDKGVSREGGHNKAKKCMKCSSPNHTSKECERYPFFTETACSVCSYYHPVALCRFSKSRYVSPARQPSKSPESYHTDTSSNMFTVSKN